MGLFDIAKAVISKKIDKATASTEHGPQKTPVPLGLHQGSVVQVSDMVHALALADGSIVPEIDWDQEIVAVGRMSLFGKTVYNCYLADGISYLRVITQGDDAEDITLFVKRDEIVPTTSQDWEFWLGKYRTGEDYRLMVEFGLIGWPQFQVDGDQQIIYTRTWLPGSEATEPVAYQETVVDKLGAITRVEHEGMEYARVMGGGSDPTNELLMVSMASCGNDAGIDVFIGLPLKKQDLKVLVVN